MDHFSLVGQVVALRLSEPWEQLDLLAPTSVHATVHFVEDDTIVLHLHHSIRFEGNEYAYALAKVRHEQASLMDILRGHFVSVNVALGRFRSITDTDLHLQELSPTNFAKELEVYKGFFVGEIERYVGDRESVR